MYAHLSGLFIYVIILVTTRKKHLPRAYTCTFKWSFLCHVRALASLCGLNSARWSGAYPCHLGLGLSDVSGYFCVQLMSFKLTTTRRVRNSALEVGLSYDSDLSCLPVGRKIIVDKEVERTS